MAAYINMCYFGSELGDGNREAGTFDLYVHRIGRVESGDDISHDQYHFVLIERTLGAITTNVAHFAFLISSQSER